MNGLADLYLQGTEIAWSRVYADSGRVPLPTYPFRRVHHPIGVPAHPTTRLAPPMQAENRPIERSGAAFKRIPLDPPASNGFIAPEPEQPEPEQSPFTIPADDHTDDPRTPSTAPLEVVQLAETGVAPVTAEAAGDAPETTPDAEAAAQTEPVAAEADAPEVLEGGEPAVAPDAIEEAGAGASETSAGAEPSAQADASETPAEGERAVAAEAGVAPAKSAKTGAAGPAVQSGTAAVADAVEAVEVGETDVAREATAKTAAGAVSDGEVDERAGGGAAGAVRGLVGAGEVYRESLEVVLDLTGEQLGLDPYDVTVDHTFVELGADSLSMLRVVEEVGQRYGVQVAVSELFDELDTPHKLASAVASRNIPGAVDPLDLLRPAEPADDEREQAVGEHATSSDPQLSGADGPKDSRVALAVLGSGLAELAAKVDAAASATSEADLPGSGMAALMSQQLRVAGQLVDGVTKLMHEQLAILNEATQDTPPEDTGSQSSKPVAPGEAAVRAGADDAKAGPSAARAEAEDAGPAKAEGIARAEDIARAEAEAAVRAAETKAEAAVRVEEARAEDAARAAEARAEAEDAARAEGARLRRWRGGPGIWSTGKVR